MAQIGRAKDLPVLPHFGAPGVSCGPRLTSKQDLSPLEVLSNHLLSFSLLSVEEKESSSVL